MYITLLREFFCPLIVAISTLKFCSLQQHQSSLNSLNEASINFGMEVAAGVTEVQQQPQTSLHLSAENSPFIGSTGTGEEEEDDDLSAEQVRFRWDAENGLY